MGKIKYGDIVVSMIGQHTSNGSCYINAGFVSEAIVDSEEKILWFNETTSGEGSYPMENFRLANMDEAETYRFRGAHVIDLNIFPFYIGQRVESDSKGIGRVVGISSDTDPSYLVALDAFETGHNGSSTSLFIGSNASITNNNGWYFQAIDLKPIGTYSPSLAPSGSFSTAIGALSGTVQTYGYGVSGLVGHSTIVSSAGFRGFDGINQYPVETTSSESYKEAPNETMVQSMFSSKEDIKHQDAIILKSKINKRKLITV